MRKTTELSLGWFGPDRRTVARFYTVAWWFFKHNHQEQQQQHQPPQSHAKCWRRRISRMIISVCLSLSHHLEDNIIYLINAPSYVMSLTIHRRTKKRRAGGFCSPRVVILYNIYTQHRGIHVMYMYSSIFVRGREKSPYLSWAHLCDKSYTTS